ncbi:MAG TPA: portal protein [Azospirillaceae bacterium]|nr:portal protein [Azospirillaceae bacterium]
MATRPAATAGITAARTPDARALLDRYAAAKARRAPWESHWQECYDHALPQGPGFTRNAQPGERKVDRLFDGTAPDAVDQLAASLLGQLTPPWSRWFGLVPGPDLSPAERDAVTPLLDKAAQSVQTHFDRSNFAVEMHQCYLDLVTGGTGCLLLEEAPPGDRSGLRFTAVPLAEAVLEEGGEGRLDTTFRRSELTLTQLEARFPRAPLPDQVRAAGTRDPQARFVVVESVVPDGPAYRYTVVLDSHLAEPATLAEGRFGQSPFINFRWLKAPGEVYGRSPVMKALPDIKTANKVVELVLKNASIAVTGIWQADDDGVLNPATIRLVPGTIIPKAVGSAGLTPLQAPGRFDVSQLVLDDLRARIRHALLVDRLGPVNDQRMTATEVLERSAEMSRILGATYGRLQSELLTPLILRAVAILRRRGEIPDIAVDGRLVELQYRSPLAQAQALRDVQATLRWLESASALGADAMATVDAPAAARWLGEAYGVPPTLIRAAPIQPVTAQEVPNV